ncbi:hypothetical protein POMI540_0646 [Schizosaccharomyces pombe]|uniref:Uncharacterized protein C25B2.08 n=1 Tax=Schizosaccharomyces pombe (strain 972 / ATCC 24843) TaxID=284812 RepID=YGB8_SCHPO|nr:uncharacterized protein SPBC25B2.08 [Schizosaccharomyces pombe]O74780.1 RecName: Full=Uncharacterized protein C25B2.08 [Schizosaccharomyces pombe 972h-]CAA21266.1 sequence orphan [Schizosaccharomyces pombe]|eukprot:NP_596076.1 uncharacterized protein SPBC25B2.08 [Schizosaccharomyces pombe]
MLPHQNSSYTRQGTNDAQANDMRSPSQLPTSVNIEDPSKLCISSEKLNTPMHNRSRSGIKKHTSVKRSRSFKLFDTLFFGILRLRKQRIRSVKKVRSISSPVLISTTSALALATIEQQPVIGECS